MNQAKLLKQMERVKGNVNSNEFDIVSNVYTNVDQLRIGLNNMIEFIAIKNATRS